MGDKNVLEQENSQDLTLEQQFSIRSFATQVKRMTEDQTKELLVKLYEEITFREAAYQQLLEHKWGGYNLEELG
jgi:hypothetical protein